ncbi:NAD(P)/FAD-dependent oxidoreductase [Myxococcota bacterium]|nr:NAD(P)/FAD-dependent oxidoreductase [Myxococcota bacterium]
MAAKVDAAFIRRAIELADLNAVRVALFQQTRDPEIGALPVAAKLDDAGRARLIDKAVAWLLENAAPGMPPEPPEPFLRELMNLATGENMNDLDFEARRDLAAFKPFPMTADWTRGKPTLPKDFHVVVVGSGFSGLAMGVQLGLLGIPYTVLDRRPEPGGTWSINRYPDIRVDTISITYEFFFEKNHPWTEYFARGPEVRAYLDKISRKYGVYENTRFERSLEKATFDEKRNRWVLEVAAPGGTETLEANVVVSAVGTFNNPKCPRFEGQDQFRGRILHPARWPDDFDAKGKRIAIVGNGSTGVQLVAPIAEQAEQVHVFQRTPQWISPRDKYGKAVEPEIRWLLDHFPGYWNWWRYMAIAALFQTHHYLIPDEGWKASGGKFNALNDKLRDDLTAYIKAQTGGRQDLIDRLIPDYAPFSRRPVVDNGWYKALTRDNVELVTDGIARLTPTGIETVDGKHREIDVLVTATGFDIIKYLWPVKYTGRGGIDLHAFWSKDGPRAYLGMMVPHFPNLFILYGPNSQPLSGGTGLPIWYVLWSAYTAQCIVRLIETGQSRVEVKQDVYERYNEALDRECQNLILLQKEGAPEKNYYVNEFGRVQVNAPWYGPDFHRMCSQVDWNDLEIE